VTLVTEPTAEEDPALGALGLSTDEVCRLAGNLKYSTLEYWIRLGLCSPGIRGSRGKRYTRYWTVRDAVMVRTIKALRDAGCPLQRIRAAQRLIELHWSESFSGSVLVWDGHDLLAIGPWGEVRSVWRKPGQLAFHALAIPVGQWRLECLTEARVVVAS
jgi:hypothetical protein